MEVSERLVAALRWWASLTFLAALAEPCAALDAAELTRCAGVADDAARLQCYDRAAGRAGAAAAGPAGGAVAAPPPAKTPPPDAEPLKNLTESSAPAPAGAQGLQVSALSARWELDPQAKQGLWNLRPYQPLFVMPARNTSSPDDSPQSPAHPTPLSVPLNRVEAEFQLSLKTKAWQNILASHADLWFAYTQQSQWQVYNGGISRPFRETDYQPEVFVVVPTDYSVAGLSGRFVSVGVVHQSNGRADPLSRSWNRVYAQFGFERGDFSLLVRPWYRIPEQTHDDDNPDINRFMGYGDVLAIYQWRGNEFTVLGRYNPVTGYGGLQATWSFPLNQRLKGYVKAFTGYGETLIDYNWKQSTIGIGVSLVDWQ
jgi:phospholipase A1